MNRVVLQISNCSTVWLLLCLTSPSPTTTTTVAAAESGIPIATTGDAPWWPPRKLDTGSDAVPMDWSTDENIVWQADIPGRGHASPCIVGDQIFISTADDEAEEIWLLSYDRESGEQRWNLLIHEGGILHTHRKNSHASGTPACDGSTIFVAHMVNSKDQEGIYLSAVSLAGKLLWQIQAGPFQTQHGYGSSPVLYRDTVIVVGDSEHEESFVAAFDRTSGEEVWRTLRGGVRNYGCPTVVHVAGRDQLVIPGCDSTVSYDPSNGKMIWRVDGPSSSAANTIVADDTTVYSSGGHPEKNLLAIRADGSGEVTDTHIAWRHTKAVCYVPTMLLHNGRLFSVSDDGIASCYETNSGDVLWQNRLGGDFSASPMLVGERIYVPDENGLMHIFEAADKYRPLAKIDLQDGGFASPVILQGKIYLRTLHHLYCISSETP